MSRGDGRIYPRDGKPHLWVAICVNGKERRFSAHTTDSQIAEKFLRNKLKEAHAEELGLQKMLMPSQTKVKVEQLFDALEADYKIRGILSKQNASHLKRARADFGEYKANTLTAEMVDAYVAARLNEKEPPAVATINRCLQMLIQAFRLAHERGVVREVPNFRKLSEAGNEREGFVEPDQLITIVNNLPADLRPFVRWLGACGMRCGEAQKLTWAMVQGDALVIPGPICKNKKPRTLPLVGELADIILHARSRRRIEREDGTTAMCELIFHREGGSPIGDFRKAWASATKKAGLAGIIPHDLRRSAIRSLRRAGIDEKTAMSVSGHKTASVFKRYAIVTDADVRQALETTAAWKATKVTSIK